MRNKLIVLTAALASLASAGLQEPIAVDGGQVAGTPAPLWTPGVRLFRGIPYAAPPVGDLRWRAPEPVIPWTGVRAADHFSPVCMQAPTVQDGTAWQEGLIPVSEDCLYLNVWTPARSGSDKLPVLVFIHGGGNTRGAASELQYDGTFLAKKGIVYVSMNYRMNVFGFLAHPDLTKESAHGSSGNYALLDQIAALQWVRRNIAKFGGDTGNVMVFGHSAGASNVVSLLASPLAKGLFQRAAVQSGGMAAGTPLAEAEKAGVQFAQAAGARSIAQLRARPAQEVLNASKARMGPVVDGWVLPQAVYKIFESGRQNDVPLIVGSVADDAPGQSPPTKSAELVAYAKQTFGALADEFLKAFPAATDAEAAKSSHEFPRMRALANARVLVTLQTKTGKSKAYWYFFSHVPPPPPGLLVGGRPATELGAYHGGELVYIWNNLHLKDWPWTEADRRLGGVVSSMWTQFAKSGDPNGPGLPQWPAYGSGNSLPLHIKADSKVGPLPFPAQKLKVVDEILARDRG